MHSHGMRLLALAILGLAAALGAAADEGRIARLIAQLGSSNFSDREDATKELDAIGPPALPALKTASQSDDVETRRRAEEVIARIEKRQETARLLTPTLVTVTFQETPLAEAVAELARKSGQAIVLGGDQSRLVGRKVTLAITDTPFWQALDRFCTAAGLVETSAVTVPLQMPESGIRRRRPTALPLGPAAASSQIVLADGKFQELPTHITGAARIRALPPTTPVLNASKGSGEVLLALGVGLESQVPLQRVLHLDVQRAVDEHGDTLQFVMGPMPAAADPAAPVFIGNVNGLAQGILPTAGQNQVPVKLKEGAKPARSLKELTGKLAVEIRTPPEPVLTVDNVMKSVGQTAKGKAGGALTVRGIDRLEDGTVQIRIELEPLPDLAQANNPFGNVQIQGGGVIRFNAIQIAGTGIGSDLGISLVDARGQKFTLAGRPSWQFKIANNVLTQEGTLLFKPQAGQGEPTRLVYTTTRLATVEIPFTLKNVPLP